MLLKNIMQLRKVILALLLVASVANALPLDDLKVPFEFDDVVPSMFYFPGFNGSWFSGKEK